MSMVDISGLDKASVLAALYNAAKPVGMGLLQAREGEMTRDYAQCLIEEGAAATGDYPASAADENPLFFDYVYGRPLKIDLSRDEISSWGFDRERGEGATQHIINTLRLQQM